MKNHRIYIALIGLTSCLTQWTGGANAQTFPNKPVRIFVGAPVGGAGDVTARTIAGAMAEGLGQPVIVETRPGATGLIATEVVAKAAPDGHNLLMLFAGALAVQSRRARVEHRVERDLAPISMAAVGPFIVVVNAGLPVKTFKDLIDLARAKPGTLHYGSDGQGGSGHLAWALIKMLGKVDIVNVPYKGSAAAVPAVASNEIQMTISSITSAQPLISVGKVRAIALTSLNRSSLAPSLPTINETGLPGFDRSGWYGLLAPGKTARTIISQINLVLNKQVNAPKTKALLQKQGLDARTSSPEEFGKFIKNEIRQNDEIVKAAGLSIE